MNRPRLDLSSIIRAQRSRSDALHRAGAMGDARLVEVTPSGPNPGALRMLAHVPADLPPGAPLVVALHGCTQTAAGYDAGTGWSDMADRLGFALLLPEQRRANNANLCFNWFEPGDVTRGAGEVESIRAMVEHLVAAHALDRRRIFVTGLSAGGAMAAVMLAAHPELFAAGAVVAGLPYGAGMGVADALRAMAQPSNLPGSVLGGAVRRLGAHRGAHPTEWPRVAVWHGDADATVHPGNADASVRQWLDLHGLGDARPETDGPSAGHTVQRWRAADGTVRVEAHRVAGMGHGVPLHPGEGDGRCGAAGAYMLDVGVSSTHGILAFWGLEGAPHVESPYVESPYVESPYAERVPREARVPFPAGVIVVDEVGAARVRREERATAPPRAAPMPPDPARSPPPYSAWGARAPLDIAEVINAAHRAAGLLPR